MGCFTSIFGVDTKSTTMNDLQTLNIEELRCNAFASNGQPFDMCTLQEFVREQTMGEQVHRHNYYMVMVVTKGEGWQLIDFESYRVRPGRIFVMYPGQVHAWEEYTDLEGFLVFFTQGFFTERYNDNNLREFPFFNTSYFLPYIDARPTAFSHLIRLVGCMLREYEQRPGDYLKTLRSYLNIVLHECKRLYHGREEDSHEPRDKNMVLIVRRFEQLIEEHFRDKRKVRDYAELLLLTPNYLNAVCNKVAGRSAGELIRERVMLEARRMLLHDARTVAEIGHYLSFPDNSYFSRFFKKYEGMSPEKFRKKYNRI